jgi:phenylacetate-CoA ligase
MSRFDALYARLPLWAQHATVSAYGEYWKWLRFGAGYHDYVRGYAARERWSEAEGRAWQEQQLGALLRLAAAKIPYYRRVWRGAELAAAVAGRLEDLPLLEKEPVRAEPTAFLDPTVRVWPRLVFQTSGSTGTPIATHWTKAELRASLAVREARSAGWAGVSFALPRATFSGRMIEPDPLSKGPFYRWNRAERQVYFSAFHLRPETAAAYVAALHKHGIRWLTGYAMSYYLLAQFMLAQKLTAPPLAAVITTSEKLTPEMRGVMERAYGCRIYEEYSTVENCLFASECEQGRLHLSPDIAVVEILRPDGTPCAPGEVGEVVATCLLRRYQVFIRYRLGDLAVWDDEPCPCGRWLPVLREVVGRLEDVVVGPDGRQMVRFHGIFVDQPNVREGQIIQETLDRLRVKVVPVNGFGPRDQAEISRRVQQRLGPQVNVVVETVAEIPRSKAGKFRAVVSLLNQHEARRRQ